MLTYKIIPSEASGDVETGIIFLPGFRQGIADLEDVVSAICRDCVRAIVNPPLPTLREGRYNWANIDPKVVPLRFDPEHLQQLLAGIEHIAAFGEFLRSDRQLKHLILVGFSQGGIEALHVAERYPALFDGVIASHPTIVSDLIVDDAQKSLPPLEVIFSDPKQDHIVTSEDREKVLAWLAKKSAFVGRTDLPIPHQFAPMVGQLIQVIVKNWQRNSVPRISNH